MFSAISSPDQTKGTRKMSLVPKPKLDIDFLSFYHIQIQLSRRLGEKESLQTKEACRELL